MYIFSMLGTLPKDFSQVATSQGYFPTWQLPKGIFQSGNFPNMQFPEAFLAAALGPHPVLVTVLIPLAYSSRSTRPQLQSAAPQRAFMGYYESTFSKKLNF